MTYEMQGLIEQLRDRAALSGDSDLAGTCELALEGDATALADCEDVIVAARAKRIALLRDE